MRDSLARLLGAYADVDIIASADGAKTATPQLHEARPQVVLLDAGLANGDSFTFLANLKAMAPDAKAVLINFIPAQQDMQQFKEAGASGFIMKDASADDLVSAIRTVASGIDLPPPPAVASMRGSVRLTKREREIKELIAAGLGNKEIAQRLNIATNTVKSHVHNMLGKLAALAPPDRRRGRRSRRRNSRRSYRLTR